MSIFKNKVEESKQEEDVYGEVSKKEEVNQPVEEAKIQIISYDAISAEQLVAIRELFVGLVEINKKTLECLERLEKQG